MNGRTEMPIITNGLIRPKAHGVLTISDHTKRLNEPIFYCAYNINKFIIEKVIKGQIELDEISYFLKKDDFNIMKNLIIEWKKDEDREIFILCSIPCRNKFNPKYNNITISVYFMKTCNIIEEECRVGFGWNTSTIVINPEAIL